MISKLHSVHLYMLIPEGQLVFLLCIYLCVYEYILKGMERTVTTPWSLCGLLTAEISYFLPSERECSA